MKTRTLIWVISISVVLLIIVWVTGAYEKYVAAAEATKEWAESTGHETAESGEIPTLGTPISWREFVTWVIASVNGLLVTATMVKKLFFNK